MPSVFRIFLIAVTVCSLFFPAGLMAQPEPTAEQLRRRLEETQQQLRASQDRKNELAVENEQLAARVSELETRLRAAQTRSRLDALQLASLRTHFLLWNQFLERHPELIEPWRSHTERVEVFGGRTNDRNGLVESGPLEFLRQSLRTGPTPD